MRSVEHELRAEFPWVPVDQVTSLVECLWAHFDGVPVRDYLPLLVWKQAKEELLDHLGSRAEGVREPRRALAAAHPWLVSVPRLDNAP